MVENKKIKLFAEICKGWESESYKLAFLSLIDELKKENIETLYEIEEIEDNSLEVYVVKNSLKTKVFSRKLTGKWLNDSNIQIVLKKIKELL